MTLIAIAIVLLIVLVGIIPVLWMEIKWWLFLVVAVIVAAAAYPIIMKKRRPPEDDFTEEELKQMKAQEGFNKDRLWFNYIKGNTCISCGKKKSEGAQLCDKCCPLCGQKKTSSALICKNCLRDVPREDLLGLSQGGGTPTKREIRVAVSRANVSIRIQKMLEAAERGEKLKYGPEMDEYEPPVVEEDGAAEGGSDDPEARKIEDNAPEYW